MKSSFRRGLPALLPFLGGCGMGHCEHHPWLGPLIFLGFVAIGVAGAVIIHND